MRAKIFYWCVFSACALPAFYLLAGRVVALAAAVLFSRGSGTSGLSGLCLWPRGPRVYPAGYNRITYLFTSDYAEASQRAGRAGRWDFGIDLLIKNNPWLGFGMGRFGGARRNAESGYLGRIFLYMDNYYLKNLLS
jgi:hypothetical protein